MVNLQEKMMSEAKMIRVMTKARKRFGVQYPAEATKYLVTIEKNKSITIFVEDGKGIKKTTSFQIGDVAEYDRFNLKYTGEITAISEKSVTIVEWKGHRSMEKAHRLDLNTFCWRNYDFDAEKVARENAEARMYI